MTDCEHPPPLCLPTGDQGGQRRRQRKNVFGHQAVVHHDVGPPERTEAPHRQQIRVTRPGTHEHDSSCVVLHEHNVGIADDRKRSTP